MLKSFLESYLTHLSTPYRAHLARLQTHPNLIIHQPIIAIPAAHPLNIRIKTASNCPPIRKGYSIFWLSAGQSFTGEELIGASFKDKMQVESFFSEGMGKYESLRSEEIRSIFKIIIQIYANCMKLDHGEMPLHEFSNLLLAESNTRSSSSTTINPLLQSLGLTFNLQQSQPYLKSSHLKNILTSNENAIKSLYEILCSNFVKISNEYEFFNLLKLVRAQVREVHEHSILLKDREDQEKRMKGNEGDLDEMKKIDVLAPILPSLRHSEKPNCILVGRYFTHLRQSFYCLEALKEIHPNEELTLPPRKNLNNYDKLLRYGYKSLTSSPENSTNEYILIINLMSPEIPEVQEILSSSDIDTKKDILAQNNLKMKSIIKLTKMGHIKNEDLKMLRILFGVFDDKQLEAAWLEIDRKIYGFVGKFVRANLDMLEKMRKDMKVSGEVEQEVKKKDKEYNDELVKSFRIIEDGEYEILNNFFKVDSQGNKSKR